MGTKVVMSSHLVAFPHAVLSLVTAVPNALSALQFLSEHGTNVEKTVDLILLDLFMPDVDGYQLLQELRSKPQLVNVAMVVISVSNKKEFVAECIRDGADAYFVKPASLSVIESLWQVRILGCMHVYLTTCCSVCMEETIRGSATSIKLGSTLISCSNQCTREHTYASAA